MKLVFTKLQIADTSKVKVSFANDSNGNPVFTEYSKAECESGIHFTEAECPDLSKIVIRGSLQKLIISKYVKNMMLVTWKEIMYLLIIFRMFLEY